MHKMAVHFADTDAIDKYAALLERGKASFEEKLWNGKSLFLIKIPPNFAN